MRKILALLATLSLAAAPPARLTRAQADASARSAVLFKNADKLADQGRAPEAIRLCVQSLRIERSVRGPHHPAIGARLDLLARLHGATGEWDLAEACQRDALRDAIRLHGAGDWRVTDARLASVEKEYADANRMDIAALEAIQARMQAARAMVAAAGAP